MRYTDLITNIFRRVDPIFFLTPPLITIYHHHGHMFYFSVNQCFILVQHQILPLYIQFHRNDLIPLNHQMQPKFQILGYPQIQVIFQFLDTMVNLNFRFFFQLWSVWILPFRIIYKETYVLMIWCNVHQVWWHQRKNVLFWLQKKR